MFTRSFWQDAAERTARTFAQALIGAIGVGAGILDIDWKAALSVAGAAALVALLSAVAFPASSSPARAIPPAVKP